MKKIVVIACAFLLLTACSEDNTPKTVTCQGKNGAADTVVFESEGDKIVTQTMNIVYSFEDLDIDEEKAKDEELMEKVLKRFKSEYKDITKGLDIKMDVDEKNSQIVFEVKLDYTKADKAQLKEAGLLADDKADVVSLKETVKGLQADNADLVCE